MPSQNQTQVFYNGNGTVDHVLDARGTSTCYGYDGAGNLTTVTPPAPLGATVISPDAVSRPHVVQDGKGQQTTATFDPLDRVTTTQYADGSTIVGTPDADGNRTSGNRTSMVDSIGTTSYQYDARNRTTQKTLPGSRTIQYGYDLASNLTVFTDAGGPVGYHDNAVDLVDTLTEPNGLGQTTFGARDDVRLRPEPPAHQHHLPRRRGADADLRPQRAAGDDWRHQAGRGGADQLRL